MRRAVAVLNGGEPAAGLTKREIMAMHITAAAPVQVTDDVPEALAPSLVNVSEAVLEHVTPSTVLRQFVVFCVHPTASLFSQLTPAAPAISPSAEMFTT